MKLIFVALCVLSTVLVGFSSNLCHPNLCHGQKHIACDNNGEFKCSGGHVIPMNQQLQDVIVNEHNKFRNKIASGQQPPFSSAANMKTMQWDNDLAATAELNVKQCRMEHDCNALPQYPYAGQNLFSASIGYKPTDDALVISGVDGWYDEYKYASSSIISSYVFGMEYGHFSAMVFGKNDRVGCALAKVDSKKMYYFACNYAFANMQDVEVYAVGAPASQCKTGNNPQYPALCSVNEPNDPTDAWN